MALDRAGDDLDRLFRHLVHTLADQRPAQLEAPFHVSELYQEILPYRIFRTQLRFDTNEDYEMAVLRLLAGTKGYAVLDPPEARDALALEADAVNPFPGAFRDYAAARVTLSAAAVHSVLAARASYAPAPAPQDAAVPEVPPATDHGSTRSGPERDAPVRSLPYMLDAAADAPGDCPHCGRSLPPRRVVVYCPFCGGGVSVPRCAKCDTELEPGWMYCISCRHPVHEA